jgi:hypothetical protein
MEFLRERVLIKERFVVDMLARHFIVSGFLDHRFTPS